MSLKKCRFGLLASSNRFIVARVGNWILTKRSVWQFCFKGFQLTDRKMLPSYLEHRLIIANGLFIKQECLIQSLLKWNSFVLFANVSFTSFMLSSKSYHCIHYRDHVFHGIMDGKYDDRLSMMTRG